MPGVKKTVSVVLENRSLRDCLQERCEATSPVVEPTAQQSTSLALPNSESRKLMGRRRQVRQVRNDSEDNDYDQPDEYLLAVNPASVEMRPINCDSEGKQSFDEFSGG